MERSHSGLVQRFTKPPYRKIPRVRIPPSPQAIISHMRLITLNLWGGKLFNPLLHFVKEHATDIDVFCFQECYRSDQDRIIAREMHADIYGQIGSVLEDHQGYFSTHLESRDLETEVNFKLEAGLAIFVNYRHIVKEINDFFIFRSGCKVPVS